jgi:hypothetical protein
MLLIYDMWKAELVHRRVHWNAKKPLGLAKLERVPWFNHHQLREPIDYIISTKRKNCYRQFANQTATVK